MKVTLVFPTYLHLSGFMSVTQHADIEMDLRSKSLTATFSEAEISSAIQSFNASLVMTATNRIIDTPLPPNAVPAGH